MTTFKIFRIIKFSSLNKINATAKIQRSSSSSMWGNLKGGERDENLLNIKDVKNCLSEIMGIEHGYKIMPKSRVHLLEILPKSQNDLPARTMQDSFTSAIIPLSTDFDLQEGYTTFLGHVRLGKLMEDMDIFAVWVAIKHLKNPLQESGMPTPYTIVTVLVDKVEFTDVIAKPNEDIRLSGHTSWVGRSTMEIVVWLEQRTHGGTWLKLTRALFLMAARDPTNTRSAPVNPIKPGTSEEEKILTGGEDRKKRRQMIQSTSLLKVVPSNDENKLLHDLYLKTTPLNDPSFHKRTLPSGCCWLEDTKLSNVIFSQPENRNLHNKVFGGFLMRQALELSWLCGYWYCKYRPTLKHISDIAFHQPIDVNSLIRMHSYVVYAHAQFIQVTVFAEVYDSTKGDHITSNVFHYTYEIPGPVIPVMPKTYQDAMMLLDGKRNFEYVMGVAQNSIISKL